MGKPCLADAHIGSLLPPRKRIKLGVSNRVALAAVVHHSMAGCCSWRARPGWERAAPPAGRGCWHRPIYGWPWARATRRAVALHPICREKGWAPCASVLVS